MDARGLPAGGIGVASSAASTVVFNNSVTIGGSFVVTADASVVATVVRGNALAWFRRVWLGLRALRVVELGQEISAGSAERQPRPILARFALWMMNG